VKTFFMSLAGFLLIGYVLLMVLSGLTGGDAGIVLTGVVIVGAVVALLICVLEKMVEMEAKLDKLLEEKADEREETSE